MTRGITLVAVQPLSRDEFQAVGVSFEKGAQTLPDHTAGAGRAVPVNHAQLDAGWVDGPAQRLVVESDELFQRFRPDAAVEVKFVGCHVL